MKVKVKVYDRCKYDPERKKVGELIYDIIDYNIVKAKDNGEEFLILYCEDGRSVSFYNSRASMFIL